MMEFFSHVVSFFASLKFFQFNVEYIFSELICPFIKTSSMKTSSSTMNLQEALKTLSRNFHPNIIEIIIFLDEFVKINEFCNKDKLHGA